MKNVPKMMRAMLVTAVCSAMLVPAAASAGVVSKVLVDGAQYTGGKYTLDLDLTGKTRYVEVKVVNGDGTPGTMVSSVKVTMGKGDEKVVVISPDQFSQRRLSNVIGTLGEDVVKDMRAVSLDLKVGGHGKKARAEREDDGDDSEKGFIHRWLKRKGEGPARKSRSVRSIRLYVTEYFENGVVWPPVTPTRPSGW